MKKTFLALLLLFSFAISFLISCNGNSEPNANKTEYKTLSREISFSHFNTVSTISSYGKVSEDAFNSYVITADELLEKYHKLFDIYYEYSGVNNIRTINKNAGKQPVEVDTELIDFLLYCKELYTLTSGKTNVMLGSVLKIWHDCREKAADNFGYLSPQDLPTDEELRAAKEHTSIDSLIIDKDAGTVYISDPKASLDVGAIAKGYTVDIIYERLVADGADSIALNIGGNIRTIGLKPDGTNWVTGITNPDRSSNETIKCRIEIASTSVVTSGDYERYFIAGEKKYHHIIDPETLVPAEYFASVSIITPHSGLADALSTALFCMTYEEGLALAQSLDNVNVIWIYTDGTVKSTTGITFVTK